MATQPICTDDPAPATWAECVTVVLEPVADPTEPFPWDPAEVGTWWTAGFGVVLTCYLFGKVVGVVLEAIKRW